MVSKSPSRTVCVLGGTGFVGRQITSQLVQSGYAVRVPTRNRERARELLVLPGVEVVAANVHDETVLPRLLAGVDAAINLVGILNENGHDGSGFRTVHVELVEKLVRACHESRVPHLLQMSALKANAESGPSHYLRSKGAGERTLKNLAGDELRYTIFQPSVIFGPEDSFINRFAGLLRICPILPLARPKARFAPVYVADVASAFCAALENHGAYDRTLQLYGPEDYSLREIVVEIARILNLKRLIVGLPDSLSRIQAWFLDYIIPGKIFTLDNYRSMAVASVGTENGLAALGITATSMRAIVPGYLDRGDHHRLLSEFRRKRSR
ncbi:MAG: complex I NDUFA9 subunit family protein [Gammaproteobacteria bacterium]